MTFLRDTCADEVSDRILMDNQGVLIHCFARLTGANPF